MSSQAKHIVIVALREETQGLFEAEGIDVVYCGIGKVNATYALMRELNQRRKLGLHTESVLNFGTVGSHSISTHTLVECTSFFQRDMNLVALGFEPGVTPFETFPSQIVVEKVFHWLPSATCGTGDSFETSRPLVRADVVDMEAYALAKVCLFEKIPFHCVKYVTDGSDDSANKDWVANLPRAASAFVEAYKRLNQLRQERSGMRFP